jgi:Uma2 family endonuclease
MTRQELLTTPRAAKLRVSDFLLLSEAGAFADYARSELIEGEIWVVNAIHTAHAAAHFRLSVALAAALEAAGSELTAYTTPSTRLSDLSLPEPDLVVAEPHQEGLLPLDKVRLVIEVADTTLDIDLGRKAALYGGHGIPEYWVADLQGRVIHQMWGPGESGYSHRREAAFGEPVEAATLRGLKLETRTLG